MPTYKENIFAYNEIYTIAMLTDIATIVHNNDMRRTELSLNIGGLRITVGYALILFIVGCLREWLALGSVFGIQLSRSVLPMASMPAGGFIVLGVVCAVWRALARKHKEYLKTEARGTLAAHPRKEVQDQ